MPNMKHIAVCIPSRRDDNQPITLGYPLTCLAFQSYQDFTIYIRDEGLRDAYSDPEFRLIANLLAKKGIGLRYWRTLDRKGVGHARRALLESISGEPYVLWIDDDMLLEPDVIRRMMELMEHSPEIGFVQGTKIELEPSRTYHNDINVLNGATSPETPVPIYFGDAALLLMRAEALRRIDWNLITRYALDGITGEDVLMSLLVRQHYEGWGLPSALGWHMSPSSERWKWEVPSDALQIELLRDRVGPEILRRALPHMGEFIGLEPEEERS